MTEPPEHKTTSDEERIVDLSEEGEVGAPSEVVRSEPYDPAPDREKVRGWIALLLLGLLAASIVLVFLSVWCKSLTPEESMKLLGILLPPLVGLVGAATGFYYGGKGK